MSSQKKIREALYELLQTFPYSQVNINSVCQKADLSRRTFVRYYDSLEDVVVDLIRDDICKIPASLIETLPLDNMDDSGPVIYTAIYQSILRRKEFYLAVVTGLGMPWLVNCLTDLGMIMGTSPYGKYHLSAMDLDYAWHFYAAANASTIKWWIEHDFQPSPAGLAKLIENWAYPRLPSIVSTDGDLV